jgi:hypothetical protein
MCFLVVHICSSLAFCHKCILNDMSADGGQFLLLPVASKLFLMQPHLLNYTAYARMHVNWRNY